MFLAEVYIGGDKKTIHRKKGIKGRRDKNISALPIAKDGFYSHMKFTNDSTGKDITHKFYVV
jgi:hypothetical protein